MWRQNSHFPMSVYEKTSYNISTKATRELWKVNSVLEVLFGGQDYQSRSTRSLNAVRLAIRIFRPRRTKSLIPTELPQQPWEKVASDLYEQKEIPYLLVIFNVHWSDEVIKNYLHKCHFSIERLFSRHGIPEILISDNSPQYTVKEFEEFCRVLRLYPQDQ